MKQLLENTADESKVFVNLTCEAIQQSPEYIEGDLTQEYETALHRHYDRQEYWGR